MAVPGIVATFESQHRAGDRRHFDDDVVEIGGRAQQAQPAAGLLPRLVHIEQHGDDLALGVGVDLAVAEVAAAGPW
jgi:hypothetical protein